MREVMMYLSVHWQAARVARRRPSRSDDRALARLYRGGIGLRSGHDHDGLDADAPRCGRHLAGRGLSIPERSRPATYINPSNFQADRYGVINPAPATPSGSAPTK